MTNTREFCVEHKCPKCGSSTFSAYRKEEILLLIQKDDEVLMHKKYADDLVGELNNPNTPDDRKKLVRFTLKCLDEAKSEMNAAVKKSTDGRHECL